MNNDETESAVQHEIRRVAPGIDVETIDPEGDLREEFDMDSMDFLNLVVALSKRFAIPITEADYARMGSYSALCRYINESTG